MKKITVHGHEVKITGDHTFKVKCRVPAKNADDEKELHRLLLRIAEYLETEGFFEEKST